MAVGLAWAESLALCHQKLSHNFKILFKYGVGLFDDLPAIAINKLGPGDWH
jgi:hypothetical protein